MIGDPATRYREDPVRIIRVVRFAAKLGFEIEPKTRAPIEEMAALLDNVPQSRTFDEMIKLLQTGHALASHRRAEEAGLHRGVFPVLDVAARRGAAPRRPREVRRAWRWPTPTRASPRASRSRRASCSPAMLWHDVLDGWQQRQAAGERAVPGAAAGDRRRVRRAHRRHLRPRQARRRHARDLDDAAALRAPRRQSALTRCSSSRAFAPASTSCACAARSARSTPSWPTGGRRFSLGDDDERDAPARRDREQRAPRRVKRGARGRRANAATRRAGRRTTRGQRLASRPPATTAPAASATAPRKRRRRRAGRGSPARRLIAGDGCAMRPPGERLHRPRRQPRRPRARSSGACAAIAALPATTLLARSSLYASAPLDAPGGDYLNAVAQVATRRSRRSTCCRACRRSRRATAASGRTATRRARSTSTCCSTASSVIATDELTLPHPRLHERAFVLRAAGRDRAGARRPRPRAASPTLRAAVAPQRVAKLDR